MSWCGGMADAMDSKSIEGNFMWVRLPPPAPKKLQKWSFFIIQNFNKYNFHIETKIIKILNLNIVFL